jgi:predicted nuclease of predicted toxin-antitoxin system
LRILADENYPLESVQFLRVAGHDVVAVAESGSGATDEDVVQRAAAERRVLLTFDRDFGALVFRERMPMPAGVIYLRLIPATPVEPGVLTKALLERRDLMIEGRFTVIDRERIRQRPLPVARET